MKVIVIGLLKHIRMKDFEAIVYYRGRLKYQPTV